MFVGLCLNNVGLFCGSVLSNIGLFCVSILSDTCVSISGDTQKSYRAAKTHRMPYPIGH